MRPGGPSPPARADTRGPAAPWTPPALTTDRIRLCEAVLGERLLGHGYELSGAVRPDPAELLRYRKVAALRRAAREPGPVAAVGAHRYVRSYTWDTCCSPQPSPPRSERPRP